MMNYKLETHPELVALLKDLQSSYWNAKLLISNSGALTTKGKKVVKAIENSADVEILLN